MGLQLSADNHSGTLPENTPDMFSLRFSDQYWQAKNAAIAADGHASRANEFFSTSPADAETAWVACENGLTHAIKIIAPTTDSRELDLLAKIHLQLGQNAFTARRGDFKELATDHWNVAHDIFLNVFFDFETATKVNRLIAKIPEYSTIIMQELAARNFTDTEI